ncbi:hypothetical protein D1013_13100 [Euzebyella marina]|uniref:Uncharacterized protein n=1 Tax=Euzebyella marina TaxID=1761453 RepID=A0A3G2L7N9_9FLAO|nr:hypothetical protein [Euzebyella marina]AYN68246.1 hypothetical protein D1013_13100 [Euzebyella marina]MBG48442.1 hypothetical protein [Pseudozobellia sp.]
MKNKPVKVSLIGKSADNTYQIQFPNLKVPVNVNEDLYRRMKHSSRYEFVNSGINKKYKNYA